MSIIRNIEVNERAQEIILTFSLGEIKEDYCQILESLVLRGPDKALLASDLEAGFEVMGSHDASGLTLGRYDKDWNITYAITFAYVRSSLSGEKLSPYALAKQYHRVYFAGPKS